MKRLCYKCLAYSKPEYVFTYMSKKEWYVEDWRIIDQIVAIYMSKPTAIKLAEALNSGSFSIDGD